jgi:hypothetical protein
MLFSQGPYGGRVIALEGIRMSGDARNDRDGKRNGLEMLSHWHVIILRIDIMLAKASGLPGLCDQNLPCPTMVSFSWLTTQAEVTTVVEEKHTS